MAKNGRCPAGQYYCYTDKKCKQIPAGFKVVGRAGMLRKENGHSVDDEGETKNGNCLLYTSPSPRDSASSRMPSSA